MTTVVCHNCHRENSAARGFCQFCGSRLALPSTEPDVVEPDEARRLQEALHGGERTIASLKHELEAAKQELVAAQDEVKVLKQKAITDALHDSEERLAEEARLRDSLAESEKNVAALRLELDAAKSQFASSQGQLKEHLTAGQHAIETVKRDLDLVREKAVTELKEGLAAGERIIASLKREHADALAQAAAAHSERLAASEQEIATLKKEHADALAQTAAERDERLAAGEQVAASLKKEHASALAQAAAEHNERLAAGQQEIAALKQEHAGALARVAAAHSERLAASEQMIASLKKEHAGALARAAADLQQKIALKEGSIEELKAKLQNFAEREKQQLAAGVASFTKEPGQGTTSRRGFGAVAMTIAAMLLAGAGGVGGYFFHGDDSGLLKNDRATIKDLQTKLAETGKLKRDLEGLLRSQNEAYQRVNEDLKRAEDQLRNQTDANPVTGANDDLQRQLTEARGANQQLQQRLNASGAELAQRKQDVTTRDQTIDQLKAQLQDAKAQEAKAQEAPSRDNRDSRDTKEMRPRRQSNDFNTTIRNLEREYGIPRIGR
jgi:DNA repair exonuclease SbcCD ATPase subunit